MAKPIKSVCGFALALALAGGFGKAGAASAWACCGEGLPNTFVMSPVGPVPVFSSTMLAVAMAPTSQPARVNGTHGAGAFSPSGVIMFGTVGVLVADTTSVQ